jgi:histidinol phosphatase-like PHP family hydrolase
MADLPPIDFHMHTTWSDGTSTLEEMVNAAGAAGLEAIALTEHVNLSTQWYHQFAAAAQHVRQMIAAPIVYYGMEVTVVDDAGTLKADPAVVQQAELLMGVVHSYPRRQGEFWRFDELSPADALELETAALLGLAKKAEVDVIGHPGGTYWKRFGPFPVARLEPVFRKAAEQGVAIDLNIAYCWDLPGMIELLRHTDPLVVLGSDAHHQSAVGSARRLIPGLLGRAERGTTLDVLATEGASG